MGTFAERFKKALIKADVTAAELSRMLNIPEGTLSQYKFGVYEPKQRRLEQIATALNVSIPWLMGKVEDEQTPVLPTNLFSLTGVIPVYGCIPAGQPVFAAEDIEEYVSTVREHPEEYIALRVKGDSMIGARITDGSIVVLHKQDYANNGDIVACGVNGDEATLKRFKTSGNSVLLLPENSAFEPIVLSRSDFDTGDARIYGVAVEVITKL